MSKLRTYFGRFVYMFAKYLPISYNRFGKVGKVFRSFSARLILSKCGSNVNIERKARFSSKCTVGNNSGIGVNATFFGEVHIGDNVLMGENCTIYTRNHNVMDCSKLIIDRAMLRNSQSQ